MKKRFALTVCVLLIVLLCTCVFAACNTDEDGTAEFTVSFDLGDYDGAGQAIASVAKAKDSKMNLPTADDLPVWEGHTFEGWKLNGEGDLLAGGAEITVTADAKYVAQWSEDSQDEKEQYTVSFDLGAYQGQGKAPASVKMDKDSKMNLPTAQDLPAWEGHTFEGWKLNNEGELLVGGAEITVTDNAEYVAQWSEDSQDEKEQYTVSYDLGTYQGQGKAPASVTKDKDSKMNLPTAQDLPAWEGHTFEGWKLNNEGELLVGGAEITVTDNAEYVAQWSEDSQDEKEQYTVSYDLGTYQGQGKAPASVTKDKDSKMNLPTAQDLPAWEGHTFEGWKLNNEGELLVGGAEITVTDNAEYVAQWSEDSQDEKEQYTVSYDLGTYQGQGKAPASVKKDKDSKMNLPTAQDLPAWEGHTFEGWKLNNEGELLVGGAEITVTDNAEYVAQWSEDASQRDYEEGSIYEVVPEEELRHLIGFAYTIGGRDGCAADFDIPYDSSGEGDPSGISTCGYIAFSYSDEESELGGYIYLFKTAVDAQAYYDFWVEYDPEGYADGPMKVAGNRVYFAYPSGEELQNYYENTVLKAEIPAELSETRLEFMLDAATHGGKYSGFELCVTTNYKGSDDDETGVTSENFRMYIEEFDSNRANEYAFCTTAEASDPNDETFGAYEQNIDKYGDEDSSVNKELESGYVFFRYSQKTGFVYDETDGGAIILDYIYDKNSPLQLEVPSQIETKDGRQLKVIGIERRNDHNAFDDCPMTSIKLPEGLLTLDGHVFGSEQLEEIYLPKSLTSFGRYGETIENCPALTTIHYAGTVYEWAALTEHVYVSRWCIYRDYTAFDSTEKYIEFDVECQDGNSLHYAKDTYLVSYDLGAYEGDGVAPLPETVSQQGVANLPTAADMPTWEGHTFTGWKLDNSGDLLDPGAEISAQRNAKYVAQWSEDVEEKEQYTVSYDLGTYQGQGKAPTSVTKDKDSKMNLPTAQDLPTWEGHTFEGWKLNNEGELLAGGAEITVTADAKYVAQWSEDVEEKEQYTVSYDLGTYQGQGKAPASVTKDKDSKMNLPTAQDLPTWEGHTFEGWKLNNEGELLAGGAEITVTADAKYVAQWKEDAKEEQRSGGIYDLLSEEELRHLIAYVYAEGKKDGAMAEMYIVTDARGTILADATDLICYGYLTIEITDADSEIFFVVYLFEDEAEANKYFKYKTDEEPQSAENMQVDGNRLYDWYEFKDGLKFYQDTVLKAEKPEALSQTRLDFMLDAAEYGANNIQYCLSVSNNYKLGPNGGSPNEEEYSTEETFYSLLADLGTNRYGELAYSAADETMIADMQERIEYYGDENSELDKDSESGFLFVKFFEKVGFQYEITEEGAIVARYVYDANSPKDVVIPAEIQREGKQIKVVGIEMMAFRECPMTSVNIPEGILAIAGMAFDYCENLETVYLPKSLLSIGAEGGNPFENCPSLKKIIYAGNASDWETLTKGINVNNWCNYYSDEGPQQLSFTVECADKTSITYPNEKTEQFTVSFDLGAFGGVGEAPESVQIDKDGRMNLPTAYDLPTWEGHTFTGWKLNNEGRLIEGGAEITVTENAKYVAQWKEDTIQREYEEGSIFEVVSEEEFRHMIAYAFTMGKQEGYRAYFDIVYVTTGAAIDDSGISLLGYMTIGYDLGDDEIGGAIYFFNTEEDAQANRDFWVSYEPEEYEAQMKVVGNRIYMGYPDGDSWYDYYENVILSTEIPETLSETRLDFMLDAATHGGEYVYLETSVCTNYADRYGDGTVKTGECFEWYLTSSDSNRSNEYAYCTTAEANDPDNWPYGNFERNIGEYGDEGSFVNKELESGYVFFRYIEKCGLQYEITDEGAIVARYVYDANSSKDVVIPDKIQYEGQDVNVIGIGRTAFRDCTMTSINIPEGVESIQDDAFACCENLETAYLPHSLTSLGREIFYNNLSLKTINYAGNASEWEELTQNANVKGWCIYRDYSGEKTVIKFIEFTVKFQDGTSLQYAADKVTATFDLGEYKGEGQAPAPLTWALGESMDLPTADELPKWEGYVFIGWKLEGGDPNIIYNNTQVTITKDSKFIAQWAIEEYFTVSYDLGEYDGAEKAPESDRVLGGSDFWLPADYKLPKWEGHIFNGWKLEGGDPERIYYGGEWIQVFSDMKFVAQWIVEEYFTVSYDLGEYEGEGQAPDSFTAFAGNEICLPNENQLPEWEGYIFTYWLLEGEEGRIYYGGEGVQVTSDMKFVAQWEIAVYYTVTYELGNFEGDGEAPAPVRATQNRDFRLPSADELPEWEGHIFIGWTREEVGDDYIYRGGEWLQVRSDTTFVAQWAIEENFNISYDLGEYDGGESAPESFDTLVGNEFWLPNEDQIPRWEGHIFIGWKLEGGDPYRIYNSGEWLRAFSNMKFVALWALEKEYTISYDLGDYDGEEPGPESVTIFAGSEIWLPDEGQIPWWEGHYFIGWKLEGEEGDHIYGSGECVRVYSDMKFVAQWFAEESFTVSYDLGEYEGEGQAPDSFTAFAGSEIWIPDENQLPEWEGHYFIGWKLEGEEGDHIYGSGECVRVYSDMKFVAQWFAEESFTVSYDLGEYEGEGQAPDSFTAFAGNEICLPNENQLPEWEGHIFIGWKLDGEEGDHIYSGGECLPVYSNMKFIAQWEIAVYYTVSFELGEFGGDGQAPGSITQLKGNEVQLPSVGEMPTWEGYVFYGWKLEGAGDDYIYSGGEFVQVYSDMKFVAQWDIAAYYDVSYELGEYVGEEAAPQTDNVLNRSELRLPTGDKLPKWEGHTFVGWRLNGDGALLGGGDRVIVTGVATYVAQWEEALAPGTYEAGSILEALSEDELTHLISYCMSTRSLLTIEYLTGNTAREGEYAELCNMSGSQTFAALNISVNGNTFMVFVFDTAETAQKLYEMAITASAPEESAPEGFAPEETMLVKDNKLYVFAELDKTTYENEIMQSQMPETLSQARLDFMLDAAAHGAIGTTTLMMGIIPFGDESSGIEMEAFAYSYIDETCPDPERFEGFGYMHNQSMEMEMLASLAEGMIKPPTQEAILTKFEDAEDCCAYVNIYYDEAA